MKLSTVLLEAPLPDDWDKSIYSENIPFSERIQYAKKRAKVVGIGSSRVAFEIPYEGRKTVLKIALTSAGVEQNREEAKVLSDDTVKQSKLFIPLIDFDKENGDKPTWIHVEYGEGANLDKDSPKFQQYFGISFRGLQTLLHFYYEHNELFPSLFPKRILKICDEELASGADLSAVCKKLAGYFKSLMDVCTKHRLELFELISPTNGHQIVWYKDHPVICDVGFTRDIWIKHYRSRM